MSNDWARRRWLRGAGPWGALALSLAACGTPADAERELASVGQAVEVGGTVGGCGYEVESGIYGTWPGGFEAYLELRNREGETATAFELLLDLGDATLTQSYQAPFEVEDGAFLLREPSWLRWQRIATGQSFHMGIQGTGELTDITPYLLSVNGVRCDATAPTVSLAASRGLIREPGLLTLTATVNDDVAVRRVVLERDGVVIATDSAAPFQWEIPVDELQNGAHRYVARAVDPSGNEGVSVTARVLVAIDNQFFGTALDDEADYETAYPTFNQVTPGNGGKWGVVESTRDVMNWSSLDRAYEFARAHGLPFKLHTLVWGQQQPAWLASLDAASQLAELEAWMAAAAQRYPDAEMVDVVNEPLHAPPAYAAALGGAGATGWDWVIRSFELARQYFPAAQLLVNDYNILALDQATTNYLSLIQLLQARGLVDGIGLQSHFLERAELPILQANLDRLASTGLPIYVSELDVEFADDARQAQRLSALFRLFWEHPSVVGITHWGFQQGHMWRPNAYLVKADGSLRASLQWIQCYLAGEGDCPLPPYVPAQRRGDTAGLALQAEDYDDAAGVVALGDVVAYTDGGDWESFQRVVFEDDWDSFSVTYAKGNDVPGAVSIYLDKVEGIPVATVNLANTGGWGTTRTVSVPWPSLSGEHNVYVVYEGTYGVANVDRFAFASPSGMGANLLANSEFEGSTSGWFTWNGTLATSTATAYAGERSLALTGRTGNGPIATNVTSLVGAGRSYAVSLWTTIAGAASANVNLTRKIVCDGVTSYGWVVNPRAVTAGTWTELAGTLTIPSCTKLTEVLLYAEGPAAGIDLFVDHASLRMPIATNLLANGTFEAGTAGWFTWSGALSSSTSRAHGGNRSLLVGSRTGNAPAVTNVTSLVAGGNSYQVSFWVSVGGVASANVNLTRKIVCDGVASYGWVANPRAVTEGSWVQLTGTLSVPTCANLSEVLLYAEGPAAGIDLYVDDVSLTR